jgi:acetylornithine deacetylase/succinyl-diaminopimelate desuccinylase-like protein
MTPATDLARLHAAIDRHASAGESAAIASLRRMVQTPSLTGAEGDATDPGTVPGQIADLLRRESGVEVSIETLSVGRDNVVGLLGGDGPVFVLDAHTDTVSAGNPALWHGGDPYAALDGTIEWLGDCRVRLTVGDAIVERPIRARHDRLWQARGYRTAPVIYGRGAFDNKGPVMVALFATQLLARALADTGLRLGGALVATFPVDEEVGMAGTRSLCGGRGSWLASRGLWPATIGPDGFREGISGVALDGSYGFVPVLGHRGVAQMRVRTAGQAAHAATPSLGVNAVTRMARVLAALESGAGDLATRLGPLFADDLLEAATLALGTTIVGGGIDRVSRGDTGIDVERGGVNVVPDWCEATIDCRHPRAAGDSSTIAAAIASTVREFAVERTGLPEEALLVDLLSVGAPCAIAASAEAAQRDPLVASVLQHVESVSGFSPWVETAPGATDATVMINAAGIKTIVEFGPAGAFAHEPHEYVERDQIAIGARILARVVADTLGVTAATR